MIWQLWWIYLQMKHESWLDNDPYLQKYGPILLVNTIFIGLFLLDSDPIYTM